VLAELNIRNFALIERQRVSIGPSLVVLTGGTGAGKSLVIDALKFVLGARASADVIRAGATEAEVEALFYVDQLDERVRIAAATPSLEGSGATWDGELVLARSVNRQGRSRASVNGRLVPAGALADLADRLIEICGQHETQALFQAHEQREIVDVFGGHAELRERYRAAHERHREAEARLRSLVSGAQDRALRRDALAFQVKELKALHVKKGELQELETELRRLESAAKIRSALRAGYVGIYESDASVLGKLRAIQREVGPLEKLVPELARVGALIEEGSRALEEAALACRDLRSGYRMDDERRQEVDERIGAIRRLSMRLAIEADEMPQRLASLEAELKALEGAGTDEGALRGESEARAKEARALGAALSKARKAAAVKLAAEVEGELADLGMKGAALSIEVADDPEGATATGHDRVEILIRTNEGDAAKPLKKIASGGEASRVMLALKARLAGKGSVPTLVFDEVDANIGGRLGSTIGRKLLALARRYQVLCVTHLPQIAAMGEQHLHVAKAVVSGDTPAAATTTTVTELTGEARVREVAQMIRGEGASDVTLAEARDMLATGRASEAPTATAAAGTPSIAEPPRKPALPKKERAARG